MKGTFATFINGRDLPMTLRYTEVTNFWGLLKTSQSERFLTHQQFLCNLRIWLSTSTPTLWRSTPCSLIKCLSLFLLTRLKTSAGRKSRNNPISLFGLTAMLLLLFLRKGLNDTSTWMSLNKENSELKNMVSLTCLTSTTKRWKITTSTTKESL